MAVFAGDAQSCRKNSHRAHELIDRNTFHSLDVFENIFGHQRLREQKYTAGQIDRDWTPEIEADFTQWLKDNIDKEPVSHAAIQEFLDSRAKAAKQ